MKLRAPVLACHGVLLTRGTHCNENSDGDGNVDGNANRNGNRKNNGIRVGNDDGNRNGNRPVAVAGSSNGNGSDNRTVTGAVTATTTVSKMGTLIYRPPRPKCRRSSSYPASRRGT